MSDTLYGFIASFFHWYLNGMIIAAIVVVALVILTLIAGLIDLILYHHHHKHDEYHGGGSLEDMLAVCGIAVLIWPIATLIVAGLIIVIMVIAIDVLIEKVSKARKA